MSRGEKEEEKKKKKKNFGDRIASFGLQNMKLLKKKKKKKNVHFVNHMLAGKVPLEVKGHYAGGRLCALKKGERDVRPIAAGETLRRLTSKK